MKVNVGTAAGLSDIASLQKSYGEIYNESTFKHSGGDTIRITNLLVTLPSSIVEGDEVYVDIISTRNELESEPGRNTLKIPLPLFDNVITAENGDLVLPIINDAFEGDVAEVKYCSRLLCTTFNRSEQISI